MKIRAALFLTNWDLVWGVLALGAILVICLLQNWRLK